MSTCLCAGQLQYGLARQLWVHIFTVLSRNGLDGALCACELCAQTSGGVQTQRVSFPGEEMAIPSAAPLSGELGVFVSDTWHEFFSIEQQGG